MQIDNYILQFYNFFMTGIPRFGSNDMKRVADGEFVTEGGLRFSSLEEQLAYEEERYREHAVALIQILQMAAEQNNAVREIFTGIVNGSRKLKDVEALIDKLVDDPDARHLLWTLEEGLRTSKRSTVGTTQLDVRDEKIQTLKKLTKAPGN